MPRGHLQEFLQESLKQAWAQDNKFIAKQLQASKHELAKLRCLLPPEGGPILHGAGEGKGCVSSGRAQAFQLPTHAGPFTSPVSPCSPLLLSSASKASNHKAWLSLRQGSFQMCSCGEGSASRCASGGEAGWAVGLGVLLMSLFGQRPDHAWSFRAQLEQLPLAHCTQEPSTPASPTFHADDQHS